MPGRTGRKGCSRGRVTCVCVCRCTLQLIRYYTIRTGRSEKKRRAPIKLKSQTDFPATGALRPLAARLASEAAPSYAAYRSAVQRPSL